MTFDDYTKQKMSDPSWAKDVFSRVTQDWKPHELLIDSLLNGGAGRRSYIDNALNTEYNRWLNEETMRREDTANSRGVADLRAAGLSPLSGFSGAAQSSGGSPLSSSVSPNGKGVGDVLNTLLPIIQTALSIQTGVANIGKIKAETQSVLNNNSVFARFGMPDAKSDSDYKFYNALNAQYNSEYAHENFRSQLMQNKIMNAKSMAELRQYLFDANYMRQFGLTSSMSEGERMFALIKHFVSPSGSGNGSLDIDTHNDSPYYEWNVTGSNQYKSTSIKADDIKKFLADSGLEKKQIEKMEDNPFYKILLNILGVTN